MDDFFDFFIEDWSYFFFFLIKTNKYFDIVE